MSSHELARQAMARAENWAQKFAGCNTSVACGSGVVHVSCAGHATAQSKENVNGRIVTELHVDEEVIQLQQLAEKQHRYGTVTIEILERLAACVGKPQTQLVINPQGCPHLTLQDLARLRERGWSVGGIGGGASQADSAGNNNQHATRVLKRCSQDRSHFQKVEASVVMSPASTEEVSRIMKVCFEHSIPVTPSGTRTGLEGGSLQILPGVMLDMSNMSQVLELMAEANLVRVQPGVEKLQLNNWLKKYGLFFPVDPGSNACVGGYASTGASGTLSMRYGTMRDNVRTMVVVLSDGRVMKTRSLAVKSSVGYNLHQLLMGTEGTLGVITELTLEVMKIPPAVMASRACFPTTRLVTEYVSKLLSSGLSNQLARAELLNAQAMACVNKYDGTNYPIAPTLFLEFHGGNLTEVQLACDTASKIAASLGAKSFDSTTDEKEINTMWQARRNALFAAFRARDDYEHKHRLKVFVSDVCVPPYELSNAVAETEKEFEEKKIHCPIAGHVGDGNFHCLIPYDPEDKSEAETVKALNDRMVMRAIKAGGTASGEHGVGIGKMKFLEAELGPVAMDIMRKIKHALDPKGILNPYKVFTPLVCEH